MIEFIPLRGGTVVLPADIHRRIRADFGRHAGSVTDEIAFFAEQFTDHYSRDPEVRLIRCILFLAQGSHDRLIQSIELALKDYRDLIMAAEYDRNERRIRDFAQPFMDDPA